MATAHKEVNEISSETGVARVTPIFFGLLNDNPVNQFIYRRGVKLLLIGTPVGKLAETPHIGNLSRLILSLLFQRGSKPLDLRLFRFILR